MPEESGGDYGRHYSEEGFWKKLAGHALKAGKEVVLLALTLYYCLKDAETPAWARGVILGALGYFILPMDLIPDAIPGVGFSDDLGALAAAAGVIAVHIKPEHRARATDKLRPWFGGGGEETEAGS